MNIKCKICGLKGFFEESHVSEFHATRFLNVHVVLDKKNFVSSKNMVFICRKCLCAILDSVKSESYRIERLYEPEIKEKKKK